MEIMVDDMHSEWTAETGRHASTRTSSRPEGSSWGAVVLLRCHTCTAVTHHYFGENEKHCSNLLCELLFPNVTNALLFRNMRTSQSTLAGRPGLEGIDTRFVVHLHSNVAYDNVVVDDDVNSCRESRH